MISLREIACVLGLSLGIANSGCGDKKESIPPVCEQTSYSQERFDGAFKSAVEKLTRQGYEVRSGIWENEEKFNALANYMIEDLNCTPQASAQQALRSSGTCEKVNVSSPDSYSPSIYYCGPDAYVGSECLRAKAYAGDCLNEVCYTHDLCYDELLKVREGEPLCLWSNQTIPCDDKFFKDYLTTCLDKGDCGFWCDFTVAIAWGLSGIEDTYNAVGPGCLWEEDEEGDGEKGKWVQVEAGYEFSCGLRENGTIECWGDKLTNYPTGKTIPSLGSFIQIALGENHGCAIKKDNTLQCWGKGYNQNDISIPSGMFTQISAGYSMNCGISINGNVECWGFVYGDGSFGKEKQYQLPSIFTQVSVGQGHICGLRTNGTVECWDESYNSQLNTLSGQFLQVSAGNDFTCGVNVNNQLECWGRNDYKQANPPAGNFTQVSANGVHACGIRADQTIDCWGLTGDQPSGKFVQVDAGTYHNCALKEDNSIQCWGENDNGESSPPK